MTFSQRLYLFLSFTHTICFLSSLSTARYLRAQGRIVHWFIFQFVLNRSCSVWLIYLHPPEINDLLSLLRFLFLLDGNGFWLGANVYCVLLNSANLDTGSLVIQMRNHWVLGFVVMGTVRPVTQRWHEVDCFVLNTGFVWFLSLPQSLKFIFLHSWAWK